MPLIDFHTHLPLKKEFRTKLLDSMQEHAIEKSVVVSGGLISCQELSRQMNYGGGKDVDAENEELLEFCSASDKLLPFYFANPHHNAKEYERLGTHFWGLKLAPAVHGIPLLDERTLQFIGQAERFGHSVYLHCLAQEGFRVDSLVQLAELFPSVSFVLGHAGIGQCDFLAVDLIEKLPQIYFETSGGFTSVLKYAKENLGIHRILFGSEFPLEEPSVELKKLEYLGIAFEVLKNNAVSLLKGAGI